MNENESVAEVPLERGTDQLTDAQQKLVHDNLGLIGVHLRRFVPNLDTPTRDRECFGGAPANFSTRQAAASAVRSTKTACRMADS